MPTPVTGRSNLHTAANYGQPLGVQCRACERRVLVPLDRIGAKSGSMTPPALAAAEVFGLRRGRGRIVAVH
jgi:hypothetical protein